MRPTWPPFASGASPCRPANERRVQVAVTQADTTKPRCDPTERLPLRSAPVADHAPARTHAGCGPPRGPGPLELLAVIAATLPTLSIPSAWTCRRGRADAPQSLDSEGWGPHSPSLDTAMEAPPLTSRGHLREALRRATPRERRPISSRNAFTEGHRDRRDGPRRARAAHRREGLSSDTPTTGAVSQRS